MQYIPIDRSQNPGVGPRQGFEQLQQQDRCASYNSNLLFRTFSGGPDLLFLDEWI